VSDPSPTARPARDDRTVVVGVCEEPDVLVQDFSMRHVTWAVLAPLMLKLVRYDDAWRPWPELAAELPTRANGGWRTLQDGRTETTWRLRRGVRWHDGTPVTAHDALFAYELLAATPPPYPHHTIVESISEMHVPREDAHALVVRWKPDKAFATFEEWGTVLPRHLLEGQGLEQPALRDRHPFLLAPVFHGPYRLADWRPGEELTLARCQEHPRGRPQVERLVFRFYAGPEQLREAVLDGAVDVTDLTGFSPQDVARIADADAGGDLEIHETSSFTWEHLDFNLDDPLLADRRVRHAIAHAVDRRQISDRLFRGRYEPAHSWLPARHPGFNPAVRCPEHDPAAAAALLDAAGYRAGPDGMRRDGDGTPLRLELVTTPPPAPGGLWTSSALRSQVAKLLREQLGRVGIAVEITLVPADELFPSLRTRSFRQLALFAWSMGLETTGYLLWHSSKIPDGSDWYGLNVSGWRHPDNDRTLDAIVTSGDPAERYALMREQQALWAGDLPALPLFFPPAVTTAKRGLRNVKPVGAFNAYITWNVWEWSWDTTRIGPPSSRSVASTTSPR
jgi:peptide/nickel transport system substrate-binding protein